MSNDAMAVPARSNFATVKDLFQRALPSLAAMAPKHANVERMYRLALSCISKSPALQACTAQSLLGALSEATQLGLEPGVGGEAYLIPYKTEARFVPGYKGLVKLARQSNRVWAVEAAVVHEGDVFRFDKGLKPYLKHRPSLAADPGPMIAVYCIVRYRDGATFEVMSAAQVEAIRARSRAKDAGPWLTDYEEMAKKTVVRRHLKLAPSTPELARAIALDEAAETGEALDIEGADILDLAPPAAETKVEGIKAKIRAAAQKKADVAETPAAEVQPPAEADPFPEDPRPEAEILAELHAAIRKAGAAFGYEVSRVEAAIKAKATTLAGAKEVLAKLEAALAAKAQATPEPGSDG